MLPRKQDDREATSTDGIIDSQSVNGRAPVSFGDVDDLLECLSKPRFECSEAYERACDRGECEMDVGPSFVADGKASET
ncbi:hypothetical protein AA0488_2647 [Kozakia baliensis NRIC 0488]|nr:hypothetical protein AA0488_2647 [Kozakia baliensis NRIC 0488]GEL65462.1 hypothetical protein KBA01_27480 [Kozakia baliensis]